MVKNPPEGIPFVFQTTVKVNGLANKDEKSRLEAGLIPQLDDSIQSKEQDKVLWAVIKNPTRLDTGLISKSMQSMHYYLNAQGYFRDSIAFTTAVKTTGDQERALIQFDIWPGSVTRIDSLSYTLHDDSLQQLTQQNLNKQLVKKGDPFAQAPISSEMDRLVELYRNNGYLRFSRSMLFGLWDTLDIALLRPSLDPFEQAAQMELLRKRRLSPTANLNIRMRPVDDTSLLQQYYIGKITVDPISNDPSGKDHPAVSVNNIDVIQHRNKFKPKIFPPFIYFHPGDLYDQRRYTRTMNRLTNVGTWRMVDIAQLPRESTDTVDIAIKLIPAKKYNFTTSVESSYSQSAITGNFVGIGLNMGLQNRNFARAANLMTTNASYMVELGQLTAGHIIQTQQFSLTNSIAYPRFIFPGMQSFKDNFRGNFRSIFTLNATSTDRIYLFNLTSLNASWGYEFSWRARDYLLKNRTYNLSIKIPNFEYAHLIKRDSLDTLIVKNPSIANLFNDGLITSTMVNFTMPWNSPNGRNSNVFRANFEESGLLTGMIKNKFISDNLYRFIKADLEYAHIFRWSKTAFITRAFAGLGYEFGSTPNPDKRFQLPFFKQYFAGGPNSMRAWQLRRLGPGSNINNFIGDYSIPDRFGDMQLEANLEYRFPLFKVAGIPVNGAAFTDMGNVWLVKKNSGTNDEIFKLGRLGTDLAIGSGAGVRVDLGFFVIRVDYAYKVKDPSPSPENSSYQNRFFAYPFFKGSQLQIGIGYPFIF